MDLIEELTEAIRAADSKCTHEGFKPHALAALAVVEKWLREKAADYKHADCSGVTNCTEPVCVRLLLEELANELAAMRRAKP